MSTPVNGPSTPCTMPEIQEWLTTTKRKGIALHLLAAEPLYSPQRAWAFLEMSTLLHEAIEEVRVMSASLQEHSTALHARVTGLRERSTALLDRGTRARERLAPCASPPPEEVQTAKRQQAEDQRAAAERHRARAETQRQDAEEERHTAEGQRHVSEEIRQTAEGVREDVGEEQHTTAQRDLRALKAEVRVLKERMSHVESRVLSATEDMVSALHAFRQVIAQQHQSIPLESAERARHLSHAAQRMQEAVHTYRNGPCEG